MTSGFSYGLRSAADRARLAQQVGVQPPAHFFEPLEYSRLPGVFDNHICGFLGCFATPESNAPWHLSPSFAEVLL